MHPESKDYVIPVSGEKTTKTNTSPPNNLRTDKKHCTSSAEINSKHIPYTVKIFYKYS